MVAAAVAIYVWLHAGGPLVRSWSYRGELAGRMGCVEDVLHLVGFVGSAGVGCRAVDAAHVLAPQRAFRSHADQIGPLRVLLLFFGNPG